MTHASIISQKFYTANTNDKTTANEFLDSIAETTSPSSAWVISPLNPKSDVERSYSPPSFAEHGFSDLGSASFNADLYGHETPCTAMHDSDFLAFYFGSRVKTLGYNEVVTPNGSACSPVICKDKPQKRYRSKR